MSKRHLRQPPRRVGTAGFTYVLVDNLLIK